MKKTLFAILLASIMLIPASISAFAPVPLDIEIDCSPNVINIGSQGTIFTIHTDIPFSAVVGAECTLNGLEISWWKSDDRGYFVAKFDLDAVKDLDGLIIGGYNELTLSGVKTDGELFEGMQPILVINNVPTGKGK